MTWYFVTCLLIMKYTSECVHKQVQKNENKKSTKMCKNVQLNQEGMRVIREVKASKNTKQKFTKSRSSPVLAGSIHIFFIQQDTSNGPKKKEM